MSLNITRMTSYALISAIEEDFRIIIKEHMINDIVIDYNIEQRSRLRIEKDIGSFDIIDINSKDLVDYFDLGDTFQTVISNKKILPQGISNQISENYKALEELIAIRNRVMHIRPLNIDDLPRISDICEKLSRKNQSTWKKITSTLEKLEKDQSFVLSLEFKTLDSENSISHNLPLPDFDETGLIGRDEAVKKVKNICYGGFPVISIVGEGGIGKTALALKVAYEILEDKNSPFESIIWITSKTTQITVNEIKEIKDAISSSIGTIQEISDQLTGIEKPFDIEEIIEYLGTFKTALFIDNLETILDNNIRSFVESIPQGSKIIITSRIGLGAYEYPIKLKGIDEKYASQLLRSVANLRDVNILSKSPDKVLKNYVNRMHCNPSYIKWFVSSIQTGLAPETVLQNSNLFLEFCMSNVYNHLSVDAQLLTSALQCEPGLKDLPEMSYLTGFDALKVQKALQELMSTNMLTEASSTKGSCIKTSYQISELARSYLNKYHKPTKEFQNSLRDKRNKLNSIYEQQMSRRPSNKYLATSIKYRDKSDRVVVHMLLDTINKIRNGNHTRAYEILEEARKLSPDYAEVARVFAYFYQKIGSYNDAREQYELATKLDDKSPQMNYWFGRFLFKEEDNADEAVKQFELAYGKDQNSVDICLNLARGYMFQHKFDKSKEILDSIEETIDKNDNHNYKVYLDSRIQIQYRTADDLVSDGQYARAIESFENMITAFYDVPEEFRNDFLRRKLSKSLISLGKIDEFCPNLHKETNRIRNWVESEMI